MQALMSARLATDRAGHSGTTRQDRTGLLTERFVAEISRLVEQLNDVLYDFEEYVDVASFDGEKFARLQALSRKAAPVIAHRITRMKLDNQQDDEGEEAASSPVSFGLPTVLTRKPSNEVGSQQYQDGILPYPADDLEGRGEGASSHGEYTATMPWPPPVQERDAKQQITVPPAPFQLPTVQEEGSPPRLATAPPDPWSERFRDIEHGLELISPRRSTLTATYSDSAIGSEANSEHTCHSPIMPIQQQQQSPALPPKSPARLATTTPGPSFEQTASFMRSHYGRDGSTSPVSPRLPQQHQHQRDSVAAVSFLSASSSSVRSASGGGARERDSYFELVSPVSPTAHGPAGDEVASLGSSSQAQHEGSRAQSPFVRPLFAVHGADDKAGSEAGTPASSVAGADGGSGASSLRRARGLQLRDNDDHGMQPVVLPSPALIPDGLMPVDEKEACEPGLVPSSVEAQLGGCELGLGSSYYQFKDCAGAIEILQGGLGVKYVRKQVSWESSTSFGSPYKCIMVLTTFSSVCLTAISKLQSARLVHMSLSGRPCSEISTTKVRFPRPSVETYDLTDTHQATENFKSEGIGFRLRFLSKSHMHAKKVGEQTYGCLFCVQQRRSTHPNDATVFFNQRQLFAHLARHPRPLPPVPGVTVVEQDSSQSQQQQLPPQLVNNYDLSFTEPPQSSPLAHIMRALTALPTATAVQTYRPSKMAQRPAEGNVLAFAAGARILGVEFPERFQGEWCVGWADHEHGIIPAEALRINVPPGHVVRNQGSSSAMKAVARWKSTLARTTKVGDSKKAGGGGEWLAFGKGEVITNIGWSHQEHFCWWGTNAKGKSGLFLRSHVEPGTLMEDVSRSDGGSVASAERRAGVLSRISIRRRSGSGTGGAGGRSVNSSSRASIH